MVANLFLLLAAGVLVACGVYLLLERVMTKMLMGLLLVGNGTNLIMLMAGGGAGKAPIEGTTNVVRPNLADPLAQGMILTAIVISMAMTAFILALSFRQYLYRSADVVEDDAEDTAIKLRPNIASAAPDHDASDDPLTGRATAAGDEFGPESFEAPVTDEDAADTSEDDGGAGDEAGAGRRQEKEGSGT